LLSRLRRLLGGERQRQQQSQSIDPEEPNPILGHARILNESARDLNFEARFLFAASHANVVESDMANLSLVYGMRLLPSEDVAEVGQAPVKLTNGREAFVTMHVLEGSKEEIEKQLRTSLEAFFDLYPEI
jgi:hypothetical protein